MSLVHTVVMLYYITYTIAYSIVQDMHAVSRAAFFS